MGQGMMEARKDVSGRNKAKIGGMQPSARTGEESGTGGVDVEGAGGFKDENRRTGDKVPSKNKGDTDSAEGGDKDKASSPGEEQVQGIKKKTAQKMRHGGKGVHQLMRC